MMKTALAYQTWSLIWEINGHRSNLEKNVCRLQVNSVKC